MMPTIKVCMAASLSEPADAPGLNPALPRRRHPLSEAIPQSLRSRITLARTHSRPYELCVAWWMTDWLLRDDFALRSGS